MRTVVLVNYGSGNLHSAHKALVRAAQNAAASVGISVSENPEEIAAADAIMLPGVGAFGACMTALNERDGLVDALKSAVRQQGTPFLGVCVGMQLLADHGDEHGGAEGLGWIPGRVRLLNVHGHKSPHMGWNTVRGSGHPLLPPDGDAYFVHSYCFDPVRADVIAAETDYGETFPAMVATDNIAGVQFHPEKSQTYGLALLTNFLNWRP